MKRAVWVLGTLTIILSLTITGMVWAKPVSFKFSHFTPPDEPSVWSGQRIEKDLNENAKDLVTCKFFHSGQMGSTIEIVKRIRLGVLQGGFMTGNYAPDLSPKFGIGTLAYCMDTYEKWNALIANDELREELYTSILDKGLRVLDVTYFGAYGMATNKPVHTLDDLKKLKMRTTQARYPVAFWKAMEVNPVPLAWSDVFPALKQGVVDGTDLTAFVTDLRISDLCKYFTRTNHMMGLTFLVVNEDWYQGLEPATREVILASIHKHFAIQRAQDMELNAKMDAALKAKGVEVIDLPETEIARFRQAQKEVWKELEPEIGKEWLNKVVQFTSSL